MAISRLIYPAGAAILLLLSWAGAAVAQGGPPAPYSGMKNPFAWDNATAQEAGKTVFQQSCAGCHGQQGGTVAAADFSKADFAGMLRANADFYFWMLSEGRLPKGMPPFKASLSEEKRWQVLTYLSALGNASQSWVMPSHDSPVSSTSAAPIAPASSAPQPSPAAGVTLSVQAPAAARAGELIVFTAFLKDAQSKAVANETVTFLLQQYFFAWNPVEIGSAATDSRGVASLEYTPRLGGQMQVIVKYKDVQSAAPLNLAEPDKPFYETRAGLKLPAPGPEIFIGPDSINAPNTTGDAPTSGFRLPGGTLSWLLFLVFTVMLIWGTYFRVVFQVFRIPIRKEIKDLDTRLVPFLALAFVAAVGLFLVLKLLTGPYSNWHLF